MDNPKGSSRGSPGPPLVGREKELAAIGRFTSANEAPNCLVITGDPGVGKTTLWRAAKQSVADRGGQLLSARACESEASFLFAALGDLMEGVTAEARRAVPVPQAEAIEFALRKSCSAGSRPDMYAVASGLVAAVRAMAGSDGLLIAIDDVQWLDPSSNECLLFLARRVAGHRIRFLLARRSGPPTALERELEPGGVNSLEVEGLSVGAVARLLADRLGLALPRRLLHRLHEMVNGNPLMALEVGRVIKERGVGTDRDPPVPPLLEDAFSHRFAGAGAPVKKAVLAVALTGGLDAGVLTSVVEAGAVEDAVNAGLLVVEGSRVTSSHPLIGAAARKHSSAAERRRLHAALADATPDVVLSARHRALATLEPDSGVAAIAAEAAQIAIAHGAWHEAEELSAQALRLTPSGSPEQEDRVLALARCRLTIGDNDACCTLLQERLPSFSPGRARGFAHLLIGEASDGRTEERELHRAIEESDGCAEVARVALCRKSNLLTFYQVARIGEAENLARQAMALSEGTDDHVRARMSLVWALALRGESIDGLRTLDIDGRPGAGAFHTMVDRAVAVRLSFRGGSREAAELIVDLARLPDVERDYRSRMGIAVHLCEFALRRGDMPAFREALDEFGQWVSIDEAGFMFARLAALGGAVRGLPEEGLRWAHEVTGASGSPHLCVWDLLEARRAVGLIGLFQGDFDAALEHLSLVWEHCQREGVHDPGAFPVAGDLAEALVETGDVERASQVIDRLEEVAKEQDHPWARATSHRGRACIAAADGRLTEAAERLAGAVTGYGQLGLNFDVARSQLLLGRLLRRARKRAESRRVLTEAASTFDRLGCGGWTDLARSEADRLSGRRPYGRWDLTPSERRACELASSGLSNKEIAKAMFVSVATVEAHLSRSYSKLGIRSRSQLASRLSPC